MHCIRADRPTDWPCANLYILADEHNGDLLNMALRNSVSDVYGETRP